MSASWEMRALRWLRVPPEPQPPSGSPGSLRVFRAGRNFLRLRFARWMLTQVGAVFGVLASLVFIREVEIQVELARLRAEQAAATAPAAEDGASGAAPTETADSAKPADLAPEPDPQQWRGAFHRALYAVAPRWLRELPQRIPPEALVWIKVVEALGILGFIVQLPWSLAVVVLDYRQRWYMVTDRSLRLRWGVMTVHEATMSFANLQQVAVHQGPLGRVLGLWDVQVESAGGGSGKHEEEDRESMHRAVFQGVENGQEIRDTILARLRLFRESGLGDPDDHLSHAASAPAAQPVAATTATDAMRAAREVLAEVRALRSQL
ncbi:MAG: PH domain-containing protein [Opitutaceae bacterium]|nr:PH domain-containing protein [Opitutaceae bacterium]